MIKKESYNHVATDWRKPEVSREELCCGMRHNDVITDEDICDCSLWLRS